VALRRKQTRKLWVWKALERGDTDRLIDWECGDRDRVTLERLLGRLEPWGVRLFCTDDYAPYDAALPAGRHYVGKDQTQLIESNNARQRHWFARFRRRTCVVSRSVEMVEATMALFAFLPLQRWRIHLSVSRVKPSTLALGQRVLAASPDAAFS
jgi:insertion element IS1 protein InsB